jgi:large subunit ribosomal protein L6
MSNLAKQSIKIPKQISVEISSNKLFCKGPFGKHSLILPVNIELKGSSIKVLATKIGSTKKASKLLNSKSLQGTVASLIKQTFIDLTSGFRQKLKLVGVGYKASIKKTDEKFFLELKIGFSHACDIEVPENLSVICIKPTVIYVSGYNKQNVSNFAACIRSYKFPEPYKGKGILYEDEKIILKDGKRS